MPVAPETVRRRLAELPRRCSLDAGLELFDALGYQYADELPLPIRNWPAGVRRLVSRYAEPPIYLAQHRDFRSAARAALERQIAETDALVYELYGLTEEEITIVEGWNH